ncbi:MAG: GntR family transcriptional regulator [Chloroflexi bacterium]|nr:GntR family transcriptional regulator [Chloroflexota bacterium]
MQKIVTDRLRSAILSGQLGPGDRLQQDELASQLQVSRMPIREALRILASEGLVELRPHRGAVVVNLRTEDIAEIFEIRAMLEGRAAELAAPRLSDVTLARLRQIHAEMARIGQDEERWLVLNRDFHTIIYPASGWPRLCALIDAQRNVVQPYLRASLALLNRPSSAHDEHCQILAAAEARDGKWLARLTVEHLRLTAQGLIAYLSSGRRAAGPDGDVAPTADPRPGLSRDGTAALPGAGTPGGGAHRPESLEQTSPATTSAG